MSWLLVAALSQGCAYKVALDSQPRGAVVRVDGALEGSTPVDLEVPWRPWPLYRQPPELVVRMPGQRTAALPLKRESRLPARIFRVVFQPRVAFGVRDPLPTQVVLVPEHGPSGTWEPEDVE